LTSRITATFAYKGLVVNKIDDYTKEKIDIILTKAVDIHDDDSEDDIKKKIQDLDGVIKILYDNVSKSVTDKVAAIKGTVIKTIEAKKSDESDTDFDF